MSRVARLERETLAFARATVRNVDRIVIDSVPELRDDIARLEKRVTELGRQVKKLRRAAR